MNNLCKCLPEDSTDLFVKARQLRMYTEVLSEVTSTELRNNPTKEPCIFKSTSISCVNCKESLRENLFQKRFR